LTKIISAKLNYFNAYTPLNNPQSSSIEKFHIALSEDFFKLKTGIAGNMLQKFINYRIKTAAIIPDAMVHKGKFKEMVSEANKGNHFRVFDNIEAAEIWLLSE
jgi:hypothetical protein